MRTYLIDPFARTIEPMDRPRDARSLLRCDRFDLAWVEDSTRGSRVGIVVDDESYYREPQAWFGWRGYRHPLGGRALVIGCDAEGEAIEPPIDFKVLPSRVSWIDGRPDTAPVVVHDGRGSSRSIPTQGPGAPKTFDELHARIWGKP